MNQRGSKPSIYVVASLLFAAWMMGVAALRLAPEQSAANVPNYHDYSQASFAYQDVSGRYTVHIRELRPVHVPSDAAVVAALEASAGAE